VSHRADVNAPDHDEGTVLHYAAVVGHSPKSGHSAILVIQRVRMWTRDVRGPRRHCMLPFSSGEADVVTVLLEHGADVHARGYSVRLRCTSRASRKVIQSSSRSYWHTVQTSMSARTTRLRHFTWRPWEATLRLLRCYLIVEPTFVWRTQRAQLLCTMPHNPAIVTLPRFC
jgi:ankyrin repeat protein